MPMLPAEIFAYTAEFTLCNGNVEHLELDVHGWADPDRLANTVSMALIPKDSKSGLPVVLVNIPEKAKPVFKTRVFGKVMISGGEGGGPKFRCYGIGYKLGRQEYIMWVLPTGDIEVGPSPTLADLILRSS